LDFTKPIAVLNTNGFYDALIVLLETMMKKGFLKEVNYQMLLVSDDIEDLLNQMKIM
jgi:predicted Rossmann-fold nucleotide-binding protein